MNLPFDLYNVTDKDFSEFLEKSLLHDSLSFTQQDIKQTYHFRYFSNYLKYDKNGLKAKTIIVEKEYTCLTYLEDYINYYAHCYTSYEKKCKRVHFFKEQFNEGTFIEMLHSGSKGDYKKNWDSYLGCIVAKPLPKGIIGTTYLRTYLGDSERDRHYTAISDNIINLFGTNIHIKTMPYLEQDGVVGSCASSALWMAFQKTHDLFHTKKPSPSEITILAGFDSDNTGKLFPSKGLEVSQICKAISRIGLLSELRQSNSVYNVNDLNWLKGFIYAYLKADIPILMGIELKHEGLHLITLNGFRFNFDIDTNGGLSLFSNYVSKFYAHDDQTGPFSRLKFLQKDDEFVLLTSWWKDGVEWNNSPKEIKSYFEDEENYLTCKPYCVIVPIDKRIKITYDDIIERIEILDYFINLFVKFKNTKITWDIYLIRSNQYKEDTRKEIIDKSRINNLLLTSLPQYIWVAKAYINNNLIFDLIFDSIEILPDGSPFMTNIYSSSFENAILCADKQVQELFSGSIHQSLYKKIIQNTTPIEALLEKNTFENKEKESETSDKEFNEAIKGFGDDINSEFE